MMKTWAIDLSPGDTVYNYYVSSRMMKTWAIDLSPGQILITTTLVPE